MTDTDSKRVIEKILDKRIRVGKIEYFIKWEGCPNSDNSWELEDDVKCLPLTNAFELQEAMGKKSQFEEIVGAYKTDDDEIRFIVKYKGIKECTLISSKVANVIFPQEVIKFYESIIDWE